MRCLGYLIIEAIDDQSRNYITEESLRCVADGTHDDKLRDLANLYECLFRFCELGSRALFTDS